MAWIESHQELRDHPKTRKAVRSLGISTPQFIGHLHLLWWWALDYADSGDLSGYENYEIADAAMWEGDPNVFVHALCTCGKIDAPGFLDECNGKLKIHDWEDTAGRLVIQRERNAAKQAAYRERHKANTSPVTDIEVTPLNKEELRNGYVTVTSPLRNGATQHNTTQPIKESSSPLGDGLTEPLPTPTDPPPAWQADFDRFWQQYPKRNGTTRGSKAEAAKVFGKLRVSERKAALDKVGAFARSEDARRENGHYVCDAVRWLREKRWTGVEDNVPVVSSVPPEGHSWEKDERGDWIPLTGHPITHKLPYGARNELEAIYAHRERWTQHHNAKAGVAA